MQSVDFDDPTGVRFSTADFPPDDRAAVLGDLIGRRFLRIDFAPMPSRPLCVEVGLRILPGLGIMSDYTLGVRAHRTKELIADGNDGFYVAIMTAGIGIIGRGHQQITIEHGDATLLLLSAAEPFSIVRPTMSRSLLVSVPSSALALLVADVDDAVMRPIPRSTEALKLLAAYVGFLEHELALATPDLRRHAASHVYDLVALAVGATSEVTEAAQDRGVRAARLRAIKNDVIDNLRRADLSIDTVAARHGVTPRYVRKLFESEDTTFSEFVIGRRLAHAHRLLTDPRFSDQAISAIAFECGFGDLSYFNRTFRRVFGAAPTDVRTPAKLEADRAL
jgi:AraC-like DNA-binding protein